MPPPRDLDWSSIRDDVGPATEVGEALGRLDSADDDTSSQAWDLIYERALGRKLGEVTVAVIPFLGAESGDGTAYEFLVQAACDASRVLDAPNSDPRETAVARAVLDAFDREALWARLVQPEPDLAVVLLAGLLGRTDEGGVDVLRRLADHPGLDLRAGALTALILARRFDEQTVAMCRRRVTQSVEDDGVAAALLLDVAMVRENLSPPEAAHVEQLVTPQRVQRLSERFSGLIELPSPTLAKPRGLLEPAHVIFAGAALVLAEHPTRGRLTLRVPDTGLRLGDRIDVGSFVAVGTSWLARIAEFVDAQGQRHRHEFDEQGLPPGPRDGLLV